MIIINSLVADALPTVHTADQVQPVIPTEAKDLGFSHGWRKSRFLVAFTPPSDNGGDH